LRKYSQQTRNPIRPHLDAIHLIHVPVTRRKNNDFVDRRGAAIIYIHAALFARPHARARCRMQAACTVYVRKTCVAA
jgi:hypothetical protein